jgi:pentapeptide MXKDX repeat protein
MKRIALALTALVAATAIAPVAYAGVDFDQLRRENLDKDAVDFDQLREENRNKVDFDQLRRENLDKDAVDFDQLRRENLDKDAATEIEVISM